MEITGFKPACWGSSFWYTLNIIAFGYPEYVDQSPEGLKLKNDTYTFFKVLGTMLPCSECKQHYKQNVDSLDLVGALESRDLLTKFVYNLHNLVNKQTGVPESKWPSYESICSKYNSLRSTNCDPNSCGGLQDPPQFKCKVDIVPFNEVEGFNGSGNPYVMAFIFIVFILSMAFLYFYLKRHKK